MRLADVADLPTVLTTAQLAAVTGIGEDTWWKVARGEATSSIDVEPIRVGLRGVLRWPTAPVLQALGIDRGARAAHAATPGPAQTPPASESGSRAQASG